MTKEEATEAAQSAASPVKELLLDLIEKVHKTPAPKKAPKATKTPA